MTAHDYNMALKVLITAKRASAYVDPVQPTDYEVLGVIIAEFCGYEKTRLKRVIHSMLEDSNFHTLNAEISKLWTSREVKP